MEHPEEEARETGPDGFPLPQPVKNLKELVDDLDGLRRAYGDGARVRFYVSGDHPEAQLGKPAMWPDKDGPVIRMSWL